MTSAATRRLFLHVGPPKTGTTYLQGLLHANRETLRTAGLEVLGTHDEHFRAANELMGRPGRRGEQVPDGAWEHVRQLLDDADADAVASCERYSMLRGPEIARLRGDLPGHEIHVVLTLRDATLMLPSQWQEYVKNGTDLSWGEFSRRVAEEPKFRARLTRVRRVLDGWAGTVPTEHLHVVTVPPPGGPRTELRDRFCAVLGVPPATLGAEPPAVNESVDLAGAELIRRLNEDAPLHPQVQHTEIKGFLVPEVLAQERGSAPPRLAGEAFAAARRESERQVELVRQSGHPVVGDLADLLSAQPPEEPAPTEVSDEEVSELAVRSVSALAQRSFAQVDRTPRGLRARAGRARQAARDAVRRLVRPAGRG